MRSHVASSSPFILSPLIFPLPLAAPPAEFQVIQITAYCFSAGCCHGTVQSDLLYPSVLKKTRIPTERPPLTFFRRSLGSLLVGLLFFFLILDAVLLLTLLSHQSDRHVAAAIEERSVSFLCSTTDCVSDFPPFGRLSHGGLAVSRYLLEKNF